MLVRKLDDGGSSAVAEHPRRRIKLPRLSVAMRGEAQLGAGVVHDPSVRLPLCGRLPKYGREPLGLLAAH
ncbi:MAG: hypothetical protein QOI71_1108 [Gaiellales bacterium]|jgi:hypothetical protein|nr:hypothetical protein [Gaiellales bacterium]